MKNLTALSRQVLRHQDFVARFSIKGRLGFASGMTVRVDATRTK